MRDPATAYADNTASEPNDSVITSNGYMPIGSSELPKGGGAIKGISEKFSANPVTGTSSFSLALPVSPARGFEPQLSLNYDSGAGNGAFGLGWNLNLPSISRKTEKGLPKYLDSNNSDTYVLTGMEDLVPLLHEENGSWDGVSVIKTLNNTEWEVRLYRPRVEGAFIKIERWHNPRSGIIWWRSTSASNVTSVYGYHPQARIADPQNPSRIFKWLLQCNYDDKGHYTKYEYKPEDLAGVDQSLPYERNRQANSVSQTYLKRVLYGIKQPYWTLYENSTEVLEKPYQQDDFHFQTVFDYGEHNQSQPGPDENDQWNVRHDIFSNYRAGFDIRSYRRCKRVLLFHQFDSELPSVSEPVSEISLEYNDQSQNFSFLSNVIHTGYKRAGNGELNSKSLPAMSFTYQEHAWDSQVKDIDTQSLEGLPSAVDGQRYQWVDLYNEGLSGILSDQAGGYYFKQNLGGAKFSQARLISPAPTMHGMTNSAVQIRDLDSNGIKSLVSTTTEVAGFFELNENQQWQNFQPFRDMLISILRIPVCASLI